jgi:hypothetical protein
VGTEHLVSLAAVLALVTGCAGARTSVVADTSRYPISLTSGVRDADGELVASERIEKVGRFRDQQTAVGMLYSGAKLTPRTDISKAVNAQVANVRGDAIVNVRVKSSLCAADFVPFVSVVPVWPGCANIVVEGDIVRVLPKAVAVVRIASAGSRLAMMEAAP